MFAVMLFVSSIAETLLYYNGVIEGKNNQISSISNEIANLTAEISSLNSQLANLKANLTSSHLVSSVTTKEYDWLSILEEGGGAYPYNFVEITGSVTNTGGGTAFNAGLHVLAYDAGGNALINMTVPLGGGTFGTDDKITGLIKSWGGSVSSMQLGNLTSGKTLPISIDIYHEGTVNSCVVTPVWTSTP
jgi:hypothetical protein